MITSPFVSILFPLIYCPLVALAKAPENAEIISHFGLVL